MDRFSNAQVGDRVYCDTHGCGTIVSLDFDTVYSICVDFLSIDTYMERGSFTIKGKMYAFSPKATLFYRNEESNYLTERPVKELVVKASKLPVDTLVTYRKFPTNPPIIRYFKELRNGEILCFSFGASSITVTDKDGIFCMNTYTPLLYKEIVCNGVIYPAGTKIIPE